MTFTSIDDEELRVVARSQLRTYWIYLIDSPPTRKYCSSVCCKNHSRTFTATQAAAEHAFEQASTEVRSIWKSRITVTGFPKMPWRVLTLRRMAWESD